MKKIDISLEYVLSSVLSIFTYLIGGLDYLFISLLILMLLDYLTGICKGIYNKELSSKISIKGIIKKFGYITVIIIANLFDSLVHDQSSAIRTLVIYFFIANEAISILENWASLGLPLPKKIFTIFEEMKKE